MDALRGLMEMVKDDVTRIDFAQPWRPFTYIVDGEPQGDALSKVHSDQLLNSVCVAGAAWRKNGRETYNCDVLAVPHSFLVTSSRCFPCVVPGPCDFEDRNASHKSVVCLCLQVSKLQAALKLRLTEQGVAEGTESFIRDVLQCLERCWDVSITTSNDSTDKPAPEGS